MNMLAEYVLSRVGRPPLSYPPPWSNEEPTYQRPKRVRNTAVNGNVDGLYGENSAHHRLAHHPKLPPYSSLNYDSLDPWREHPELSHNEPGLILSSDHVQPKLKSDDKTPLMFHDSQGVSLPPSLLMPNLWNDHQQLPQQQQQQQQPHNLHSRYANYDPVFRGTIEVPVQKMHPSPSTGTRSSTRNQYPMTESCCCGARGSSRCRCPVNSRESGWSVRRGTPEWDGRASNGHPFAGKRRFDDAATVHSISKIV